eukprot:NODE_19_length_39463_cov_0.396073.p19 type:complete len:208 gc:universal NODE_19_length_39463_cov_0.396073:7550-6927(-)
MITVIIEHFDEISDWSIIEYTHLSHHCRNNNTRLVITNYPMEIEFANCIAESIVDVYDSFGFDLLILADLNGDKCLTKDKDLKNENLSIGLIVGGMLGDDPPVDREGILRNIPNIRCRTMTTLHLPTDVAGICGIKILKDKWELPKLLESLQFPTEFKISKYENHYLPFAYFKESAFDYKLDFMDVVNANGTNLIFGKNLKREIIKQ